ncbi:MAG: Uma2 family endonuclease [Pyrinomonadaceae bacterium]|nr:Uma2 family endonuclease [Pyrinomonadaceae bacterium]
MTALPKRKIFTVNEYHKMIDAGVFVGNSDYELIEGEIVKKMTQGDLHIACINRLNMFFAPRLAEQAIVSIQNAVVISDISEPEPDVALLKFREDFYASGKARAEDVLLLIEVSDSTVKYDRDVKVRLYAEAEVAEVWLINLPRQLVEVYTQAENGKYKIVGKFNKTQTLSPKFLPDLKIKVADILG